MSELFRDEALVVLERHIDEWLGALSARNSSVVAVDRGEGDERRWFIRMRGEEKEFTTIWLLLGQRTLRYETYVMPAPEENAEKLYEFVLRCNERLVGVHFSIGIEDAIFLRGDLPLSILSGASSEEEFDRVIGTMYATVERFFQTMIRIGFASRFAG